MNLNKYSWQRTCISWSERKRSICRVISWTRMNGHSQGCDSNRSSRGEKKKIETFGTNDGMKKNRNLFIYFFHLPPSWMEDLFEPPIPISKIERSSWSTICTEGYQNRHCSKSTIDGIVRTVKWWIAVGVKSWRELVLTETRIRTIRAKSDSCRRNSVLSSRLMVSEFWNTIDKIVYNRTSVKSTKLLRYTRLKLQFIFSN